MVAQGVGCLLYTRGMVEASALKNAYLVAGLGDDEIAQIAGLATIKTYTSGQSLTRCNEAPDQIFVIMSGNVVVTTDDGDRLGEVGENSVVGEVGLVDARPRTANVTCVGPVSAAVLATPDLRRLLNQNRQWGFIVLSNIARVLASRLRQANARIDELTDLTTEPWTNALG